MSLFYQHYINEATKLAIWHLEEPESYFLKKVPRIPDISHPHKRLQHLAGRFLLPFLFEDFPLESILITESRKPFLEYQQYHFSISHCGDYAAAIVSKTHRVGLDLEKISPRILSIGHKFLSPLEYALRTGDRSLMEDLTLIWSAKEAVFKWHGKGQLDFKEHIRVEKMQSEDPEGWMHVNIAFQEKTVESLEVHARFLNGLTLAWLMS